MDLRIQLGNGTSLHSQLVRQVRAAILSGDAKLGEQLPSVRQLSRQLGINPLTVAKAYLHLEHQGFIATRWGKGSFVAERLPARDNRQAARELRAQVDRFIADTLPLAESPAALLALVEKVLTSGRGPRSLKTLNPP